MGNIVSYHCFVMLPSVGKLGNIFVRKICAYTVLRMEKLIFLVLQIWKHCFCDKNLYEFLFKPFFLPENFNSVSATIFPVVGKHENIVGNVTFSQQCFLDWPGFKVLKSSEEQKKLKIAYFSFITDMPCIFQVKLDQIFILW